MKKNKPRKTRCCNYYHNCDRDEDCFNGENCPMFKFNPGCSTLRENKPKEFDESAMDEIWEGEK